MTSLVIIESVGGQLNLASKHAISAALEMKNNVKACILGTRSREIAEIIRKINAVNEVLILEDSIYDEGLAEPYAEAIIQLCARLNVEQKGSEITHIVAAATTFGKNILPRIAAKLNVGQVSDIIKILDSNTYQRFLYAGNVLATVQSLDPIQIVTIRASAFPEAIMSNDKNASVTAFNFDVFNEHSIFLEREQPLIDKLSLDRASVVIAGGRGLGDVVTFNRLANIATQLNAAIGATRAAVDAEFAPNELQVGQTGHIVAPKLYIAVGISGALQHLAGMKESGVIVAINKDPEAPIFEIADYGLVADVHDVLKEWEEMLKVIAPKL